MHDTDFDHSHEELYALSSDIEGLERLSLTSVGIDIGSSTTHLLFSLLTLRREGAAFSTRFEVCHREILWASPVLLTPYLSGTKIDFDRIRRFIDHCYDEAGLASGDIDTGAVVITGEALKKENARPIAEYFAAQGGVFVSVSAGPHHEALLAAHGSGAVQLSKTRHAKVLNVDIGGGTTKLSLIEDGVVVQTAALAIGARLLAFDETGKILRLEKPGSQLAQAAGLELSLGDNLPPSAQAAIAERMAQTLIAVLQGDMDALARKLLVTPALNTTLDTVDQLVFSGGVSEYIQGQEPRAFGDLGPLLGAALKRFAGTLPSGMLQPGVQGLRATVIGASEYTIQVSGTTSFAADMEMLPLYGLKVIPVACGPGGAFSETLEAALAKYDLTALAPGLALSLFIGGEIDYDTLKAIGRGIAGAVRHDPEMPVIVNIEQDVGLSLGTLLKTELALPNPLLTIDGIKVGDLDYIDIGQPIGMDSVFPVTVKSLLFSPET